MASGALSDIPEVVDSTSQGPYYRSPRVFPVTPEKPWVNQSVAYLRHHVGMVVHEVANQCREPFSSFSFSTERLLLSSVFHFRSARRSLFYLAFIA